MRFSSDALRSAAKPLYFGAHRLLRTDRRLLGRLAELQAVPILNLHRVSPESNPFWNPMSPELFEDLIVYLKKNTQLTTLGELAQSPPSRGERPSVVLSFDDGYADFVEHAMPILSKHGVRANMNVIPEAALSGRPTWNYRLYDFLSRAPHPLLSRVRVEGFSHELPVHATQTEKQRFGLALSIHLKQRPRLEREALWAPLEKLINLMPAPPRAVMMSVEQIREAARTHEIGAHSYSHESMGYESREFFEDDFKRCAEFFKYQLGLKLEIYAFPNGSHRPEQPQYLVDQGIRHVLLVEERLSKRAQAVHTRLTIGGASASELRFQALGFRARGGRAS